ncbi:MULTISPECIES: hypothetical protein [unclassified Agrococcus]|uniref:hypothetical protein n=1 Tax=unclassified Agrococcus TaxID=2615065 RepID=UPI00361C5B6F
MPAAVPGHPAPRSPALDLLVEQVARVVARARAQQGDAALRARVDAAISPEDAATAARVLRVLARELDGAPVDLGALDARLRALAAPGAPTGRPEAERGADADAEPEASAEPRADDRGHRPPPPTGLRSAMHRRRR